MSDLLWDDVRQFFDPDLYGVLPDLVVNETDANDWQALLDLIRSEGWEYSYSEDNEVLALPTALESLGGWAADEVAVALKVWPAPGLLAVFRPWYGAESIGFDIDAREVQGQEQLDLLCAFVATIGRRLRKPVLMTAEGAHDGPPLLGFDVAADRMVQLWDSDPPFG